MAERKEIAKVEEAKKMIIPLVSIYEEDNQFVIKMELPGVKKEDIEINLDKNYLTVQAQIAAEEKKTIARLLEFEPDGYKRTFKVDLTEIDASKIEAKYDAGVLTLILPKQEALKPKRIEIK